SGKVENKAVEQTYDYDKLGNLVRKTDGRNNSTLRMYDSAGLLAWEKNAVGAVTQYRYDSFGNKTHTKDAMGNFILTTYNKRGLVTREGQIRVTEQSKVVSKSVDPYAWYGASGSYGSYGSSGSSSTYITIGSRSFYNSGLTHTYIYDQAGRRIQDITGLSDNGANTVYTQYDANGNVIAKRTMERVVTRYEYDEYNRKSIEITADGRYQKWWHDSFGNVTQRRDLSGRTTSVKLNAHKQVEKETNGDNVNTYTYWNNGALKSVARTGSSGWDALARNLEAWSPQKRNYHSKSVSNIYRSEVSRYDYDRLGNRTSETHSSKREYTRTHSYRERPSKYGSYVTRNVSERFVYDFKRTTTNKYNARGQLVEVTSPQQAYSPKVFEAATSKYGSSAPKIESNTSGLQRLQYYYDEVGNRRRVYAEVIRSGTFGAVETQDHYYTYDSVNRVLVANAVNATGGYKEGTRSFTYDNLNRRTREIKREGGRYDHERYTYLLSSGQLSSTYKLKNSTSASISAATYRQSSRDYDSYGRLTREYNYAISNGEGNSHATRGSTIKRTDYSWGSGSRLNKQTTYNLRDISRQEMHVHRRYGNSGPVMATYPVNVYDHTELRKASEVIYNSYDGTGNVLQYTVNVNRQNNVILKGGGDVWDYTEVHTKSYFFGISAQQQTSNMTTTRRHWRPNNTTSYFDRFGELMYVRGSNTRSAGHDRMLISNRDGQVLFRRDGNKMQDFYYANGKVLGESGTLSATNFESHMVSASKMQQSAPGTYAVSNGDTLKGIAQKLWGDPSLWYLIADANSIEPTAALQQGMSLTIPTVNSNVHNNDSTFKPYNAADAIGKIDAEAIHVPPPSNHGCATMIVAIVVIVVAAVVTYGASTALATPAATGVAGGATAGGAAAAGGATLSASGAMLAGAAGAAAGNAAGQLVGMALGVQDGFDLGGVFKAGARGALAAGVGIMAGKVAGAGGLFEQGSIGYIAARSAVQAGGNYLTNAVLEGHSNFSWKALAANVAGSMAGHYAGEAIGGDAMTASQQFTRDLASSFAGGYTEDIAREWMDIGGKRGFENIAVDAFGNALGNSVVGAHKVAAEKARAEQIKAGHAEISYYGRPEGGQASNEGVAAYFDGGVADYTTLEQEMTRYGAEMLPDDYSEGSYSAFDNYQEGVFFNDIFGYSDLVPVEPGLGTVPILPIEWAIDGMAQMWDGITDAVTDYGFWSLQTGKVVGGIAAEYALDRTIGKFIPDNLTQKFVDWMPFGSSSNMVDALGGRRVYLNEKFGRTGDLNADINIRGNRETAINFYMQSGYSDLDMVSHLNGIDFTKPVEVVKFGKGQSFYQWDAPTTYRGGQYFAIMENSTPSQLGINPSKVGFGSDTVFNRIQTPLITNRAVYGLKSTAAPIKDTWSVGHQPFMTAGGAPQIFTTDLDAFSLNSWKYYGQ
ncbi:polymorphic toxin type 46 domain-containing protein, partial [Photobacterium kasasachensis]|uniref:polymorphic toxin type 46 domain-containing protein n=1 Tax=Photobacterium kasasachensis TaxID=2910240 RepID=UPI003D13207E